MNLFRDHAFAALLVLSLVAAGGCNKDEAEAPAPSEPEATAPAADSPEPAEPTEPAAAADETPADAALAEYETIRAALAEDDINAAIKAAPALQQKAAEAAGAAEDAHRPHLEALAKAADALAASSQGDAVAARKAFGEASRAVVALLAAVPELREGRHIFECPMAKGYKKWVQRDEELENPYMGQKMLSCGGSSDWEVGG